MPSRGESDGDQAVHGVPADVDGDLAPAAFRHGLGQLAVVGSRSPLVRGDCPGWRCAASLRAASRRILEVRWAPGSPAPARVGVAPSVTMEAPPGEPVDDLSEHRHDVGDRRRGACFLCTRTLTETVTGHPPHGGCICMVITTRFRPRA